MTAAAPRGSRRRSRGWPAALLALTLIAPGSGVANGQPTTSPDEATATATSTPSPTVTNLPEVDRSASVEGQRDSSTQTETPEPTAPAPTTAPAELPRQNQQAPRERQSPPVRGDRTQIPADAPPSFEAGMDLPYPSRDNDRERGRPSHSYRELPELPPGHKPSYDPESLPEGVTEEDAETAERMTLAATPGCRVFSPMPYEVCGAILQRYEAMGGPNSWLGLPNSPEYTNPDGVGKRSQFINGSIYWHPHTGAHPVTILYMTKWNQFGWEMGWLGYPTGAEIYHNNGGSRQEFQGAGLFWSQPTGVYAVGGAIRAKYNSAGGAEGPLGYPTTDELTVNKYNGRYNNFTNGTITWSGLTGARLMYAAMRDRWAEHGREDGQMGYPLSDVQIAPDGTGRYLHFEDGSSIYWYPIIGAWRIPTEIFRIWAQFDFEKGRFGYPASGMNQVSISPGELGIGQSFQRGSIIYVDRGESFDYYTVSY